MSEAAAPAGGLLGSIDLGSNSFHMMIVRVDGGELQIVDRLRERVRLAAGLDEKGRLTKEAQAKALACLERFGERVRDLPRGTVRAVGTNTLRQARNGFTFLVRASKALGHPIEVISGQEEARLIYLGVSRTMAPAPGRRLVVDIGGGSTECIVGQGSVPDAKSSLHMGCVSWSLRYFGTGRITLSAFEAAELAARVELQRFVARSRGFLWTEAVGASGTIRAVDRIARENGWSLDGITPSALGRLRRSLISQGEVGALSLPGLAEDRVPVICGGVAVLCAIFEALGLESLDVARGALREGVLHDLVGRLGDDDVRDQTVRAMQERWSVDTQQAARVGGLAGRLFDQVAGAWDLSARHARMLGWAAGLHEVGLSIAHSGYHKHGAYMVRNSDMAGFSARDQVLLSTLVHCHRRRWRTEALALLPLERRARAARLCRLLRLAVRLHRSRSEVALPPLELTVSGEDLALGFPEGWLSLHPLTAAELEREADYLRSHGMGFAFG